MTHLLTRIDATLSQTVTQCVWTVTHFECFNNIISKFILNLLAKYSKYIWQNKTNIIQPIFKTKRNNGQRSSSLINPESGSVRFRGVTRCVVTRTRCGVTRTSVRSNPDSGGKRNSKRPNIGKPGRTRIWENSQVVINQIGLTIFKQSWVDRCIDP